MREVTTDEAKIRLSDLIAAAINGEEVFITEAGKQVIRLAPVQQLHGRRQAGSAKGLITMSPDFDAPLDDFAE